MGILKCRAISSGGAGGSLETGLVRPVLSQSGWPLAREDSPVLPEVGSLK